MIITGYYLMTSTLIPAGWSIVTNPDQRLLEGATASHSNRFLTKDGGWMYESDSRYSGFEMLQQIDRVGEPVVGHSSGAAIRMEQDGLAYARNDEGVIISFLKIGYYSSWEPLPGFEDNDICAYCGADNGKDSEYRNGYDCCVCGSN